MLVDEFSYPSAVPEEAGSDHGLADAPPPAAPQSRGPTNRASTWTCLLPPSSSYRHGGDGLPPGWVQELLRSSGTAPATVAVVVQQHAHDAARLSDLQGLVGVNCPRRHPQALRQAGFDYVREFAVIPSLSDPRLFIPLDSATVSAGAFGLYAPLKFAARCKAAAARTAAKLGLSVWYRDHIIIALRQPSPLERALADLFPGEEIRLALASGSAPPALNRKITVAVLNTRGVLLAFAKLPGPLPISQRGIRNSARMLRALAERPTPLYAPQLLFGGTVSGTFIEVTRPLPGRMPRTPFTSAHQQFLDSLGTGRSWPIAETEWGRAMLQRQCLLTSRGDLKGLLERLLPRLCRMVLPTTAIHGDFAPWNLRLDGGRILAFDWETGSLEGPPLIDRTHYLLSVGYLVHRWTVDQALGPLIELARSRPDGLPDQTVITLQVMYLLDYLLRLIEEGYDDSDARFSWCRQLALQLSDVAALNPERPI